jgi:hypothetical protein
MKIVVKSKEMETGWSNRIDKSDSISYGRLSSKRAVLPVMRMMMMMMMMMMMHVHTSKPTNKVRHADPSSNYYRK